MADDLMTDFEIEEDGIDCVDEEFDEMTHEWEDDVDAGYNVIPELYFCNPDPYAKREKLADGSPRRNIHFDENGNIIVRNPSAYWIPELSVTEEIDGTIYTVSGTYEGSEGLDKKLARIMLHNLEDF